MKYKSTTQLVICGHVLHKVKNSDIHTTTMYECLC